MTVYRFWRVDEETIATCRSTFGSPLVIRLGLAGFFWFAAAGRLIDSSMPLVAQLASWLVGLVAFIAQVLSPQDRRRLFFREWRACQAWIWGPDPADSPLERTAGFLLWIGLITPLAVPLLD